MLVRLNGIAGVEELEKNLDTPVHSKLVAALNSLKTSRNAEAHTYLKGITRNVDAPSITSARFIDVYGGLVELDTKLQRLNF
jgi:hypothetical protein